MTTFVFQSDTATRHQVHKRGKHIQVDGTEVPVRELDSTHYVTKSDSGPLHARVVTHGDTIYLQLNGRSCTIERIDPARGSSAGGGASQGGATAPMPGVVINWIAQPGTPVKSGDALLVIESMKLQMTIEAPHDGTLAELPFQPGQTFQRGAVLARVHAEEAAV
ncbi:MAG: acetyl-CoA carboxylase biotin carboxyl carrier protein subunit [Comamonadaceae bacterium]|nr:acetyl-CoA carboxylase biotin carboxyl carrier protein subunit [Comamonadaceae bacterium]